MEMAAPSLQRERLVLACMCACTALVVGFVAAINLAVPKLAASALRPSSADLLWIVDAYVIVFACLVIPCGAVGDRLGRKGALLAGVGMLAGGAAISALAPGVTIMLGGRALSGLGAALVLPNCVAVLIHATAPQRRTAALATWAAASGIGGVLGNVGGGALLAVGSWQLLFWAVAGLAVVCATWALFAVPRMARHQRSLDLGGAVVFVGMIVALLAGIIEGPEQGWDSPIVIGTFALSVILGTIWAVVELRSREPMLDPRLFLDLTLSSASLGMLVAFFGNFGLFYVNASLLQYGRGFSVLGAGLGILPLTLPLVFGTRYVPGLVKRFGMPATLSVAFLATAIGLFGLSLSSGAPYAVYAIFLVVVGIGIMLAGPCLTAEIAQALPPERAGIAGGLQSATRELGSALGVAVIGTVLAAGFADRLPALGATGPAPHTVAQALAMAPARHDEIVRAFVTSADTALQVASAITLLAGIVVVVGAAHATRGRR